jgi:hypothetical protein
VHASNDELVKGLKNAAEVLREVKIGGRHGVKRRCCEARSAYCMTGVVLLSYYNAAVVRVRVQTPDL